MNAPRQVAALMLIAGVAPGCLTYRWTALGPPPPPALPQTAKLPEAAVTVEAVDRPHEFMVRNGTDHVVYVSPDRSILEYGGQSHALVSGETKVLHSDLQHREVGVAPGTSATVSLYTTDEIQEMTRFNTCQALRRGGCDLDPTRLIPTDAPLRFRIAVHAEGAPLAYLDLQLQPLQAQDERSFTTEAAPSDRTWCYVTAVLYGGYCWFVSPDDQERAAAQKKAKELLGPAANVEYRGRE